MQKKYLLLFAGFLLVLNVFCWKEVFALSENNNLQVYFLNVGQGDSAFVKTPENHQIVIDGGPDSSASGKISSLMPFWDKTIDVIILSHPEKDHMQGLMDILKKYRANYILDSGIKKDSAEYKEWEKILENQKRLGAKVIAVKAGDIIKLGDVSINILFPYENFSNEIIKNSANESCVVLDLIFGKNSFLFTGDISDKSEKELMIKSDVAINADVLKVAHHGSKYSTSEKFLEFVSPEFAVICVGKNSYGHPTPEVLQRLEKFGIKVLRTDTNGNVKFVSDGKNLKLITN
jgi:competence protein ComEC